MKLFLCAAAASLIIWRNRGSGPEKKRTSIKYIKNTLGEIERTVEN